MSAPYTQGKCKAGIVRASLSELQLFRLKVLLSLHGAEKFPPLGRYRRVAYKWAVPRTSINGTFQLANLPRTVCRKTGMVCSDDINKWYIPTDQPPTNKCCSSSTFGSTCSSKNIWDTDDPCRLGLANRWTRPSSYLYWPAAAPHKFINLVICTCKSGCGKAYDCKKSSMVFSDMCTNKAFFLFLLTRLQRHRRWSTWSPVPAILDVGRHVAVGRPVWSTPTCVRTASLLKTHEQLTESPLNWLEFVWTCTRRCAIVI